MGSGDLYKALSKVLHTEHQISDQESAGKIQLSPYLALVVAIIYMMAADGSISESESSLLQSIIGDNKAILNKALRYAEATPIEQFLNEMPQVLDGQNRICVLLNVCETIMADGELAELELNLFSRMQTALGYTRQSFKPYYDTIALKNKRTLLGSFDTPVQTDQITPPLALVIAMLYMMSSDGTMAQEEIGQLNVLVGGSPSLLKVALKYVRTVKAQDFLKAVEGILTPRQKLCILTNVCDAMLVDGRIDASEKELFKRMLSAFRFSEEKFSPYLNILYIKNEKPKDKFQINSKNTLAAANSGQGKNGEDGLIIDRKSTINNKKSDGSGVELKNQEGNNLSASASSALASSINRTMQDNIARIETGVGAIDGLEVIADNSHFDDKEGPNAAENKADTSGTNPASKLTANSGLKTNKSIQDERDGIKTKKSIKDAQGGPVNDRNIKDSDFDAGTIADGKNDESHQNVNRSGNEGIILEKSLSDADAASIAARSGKEGPSDPRRLKKTSAGLNQQAVASDEYAGKSDAQRNNDGPVDFRNLQDQDTDTSAKGGKNQSADNSLKNTEEAESGNQHHSPLKSRMRVIKDRTLEIKHFFEAFTSKKSKKKASRSPNLSPYAASTPRNLSLVTNRSVSDHEASKMKNAAQHKHEHATNHHHSASQTNDADAASARPKLLMSVLMPLMIVTHGFSSYGESSAQGQILQHENLATNAQVVQQALTVQQTMYQLNPEEILFEEAKKGLYTVAPPDPSSMIKDGKEPESELQKILNKTEHTKQEFANLFVRHEKLSSIAAQELRWFVFAKAILLLGLGMCLWGFFYKSKPMMHGATAMVMLGTLSTMNGYFLFINI